MTHLRRWPTTLGCQGTMETPHELVTWLGSWVPEDESSNEPACWVCGAHPYSTPPRYPYPKVR
jgi:hypothetical protein